MTYQVYILYSEQRQRHYIGCSNNLSRRLAQHNAGLNTSTRHGVPWSLLWHSHAMDKTDALKLERKIKKRGAARFLEDQIRN